MVGQQERNQKLWNELYKIDLVPDAFKPLTGMVAVGGCVRDAIYGIEPHDIDLASPWEPDQIMEWASLNGYKTIPTGIEHGTVTIISKGVHYEHTTYRKDVSCDGRSATVAFSNFLSDDLARRDFTCNAMAVTDKGRLIDPFDGVGDMSRGVLKTVGNASDRFQEDYLRIIRAARFAARFKWRLDNELLQAAKTFSRWIPQYVSAERITDEFNKAFKHETAGAFLDILYRFLVIDYIIPEYKDSHKLMQNLKFHPEGDVWSHVIETVSRCEPKYRWNALFHDIGKPSTATINIAGHLNFYGHPKAGADMIPYIAERMRWSSELAESVEKTTLLHMFPRDLRRESGYSDKTVRRLRAKAGKHFEALHATCKADSGQDYEREFQDLFTRELAEPIEPVLKGRHLMEAGVKPSVEMGLMLKKAFEIQIEEGIFDIPTLLRRVV